MARAKIGFFKVRAAYRNAYSKARLAGKSHADADAAAQKSVSKEFGMPWSEIIAMLPALIELIKLLKDLFK